MISTFTAFADSNVFYGARLRSLLLFLAQTGLFRIRWSDDVHREGISNLVKNRPDLHEEDLQRTREQMDEAVMDCLVTGYEPLIPALTLPDENDRHILAAAIKGQASVIVTFNLADFPNETLANYGMHARHPDEFILDAISIDEEGCLEVIQDDLRHYVDPKLTVDSYIDALAKAGLPQTAEYLRSRKIIFE